MTDDVDADWPDWMLHYAGVRSLKLAAEEAVRQHYHAAARDEPTEHATGFEAGRAAAINQIAEWRGA